MAKKLPLIISILSIAASFCCQQARPASAMVLTDTGERAWSIDEMNELYYKFEAEKDTVCGQDIDCRRNLGYERSEVDKQYSALQSYAMSSMVLSAINPSQNTVRLFFRDIDFMAMEMEGEERHNPLTETYVAWLDNDYNGQDYTFVNAMRQNLHPVGLHEIYRADVWSNGDNWIPVETEIEISAPDAQLELNDNKLIMLFALNEPSSVLSWVYYSSCVDSLNYQSGMECRRMYSENGGYVYVPFWPETTKQDTSLEDNSIDLDSTITEIFSVAASDPIVNETNSVASQNDVDIAQATISDENPEPSRVPSTPDTGVNTDTESLTTQSQWWLNLIYGLGLVALIWLFWPVRSKTKRHKNHSRFKA